MRIEKPYRHKMRVTLSVEYDTYCDHVNHFKADREQIADILRREALSRAVNPNYEDGDNVRVTHVEVMDCKAIPDIFTDTFRSIARAMEQR